MIVHSVLFAKMIANFIFANSLLLSSEKMGDVSLNNIVSLEVDARDYLKCRLSDKAHMISAHV